MTNMGCAELLFAILSRCYVDQQIPDCHDRISNNDGKTTFSPTIAESRTSQDAQKRQRARSFGLIAFRTPRLPRFTFCATAEIET